MEERTLCFWTHLRHFATSWQPAVLQFDQFVQCFAESKILEELWKSPFAGTVPPACRISSALLFLRFMCAVREGGESGCSTKRRKRDEQWPKEKRKTKKKKNNKNPFLPPFFLFVFVFRAFSCASVIIFFFLLLLHFFHWTTTKEKQ